jgi:hypothetical protein
VVQQIRALGEVLGVPDVDEIGLGSVVAPRFGAMHETPMTCIARAQVFWGIGRGLQFARKGDVDRA